MQEIKEHIATKKLIPQLRFKEFDGACSVRVYSELAKVIDCKHRTPPYVEEGIPLVSPGTIKWGEIDLISPKKRVSEKEYESLMDHCSPALGDLVFSRNQSIGVASYLKKVEKFVLGQDTVLIQSKEIDSGYNYFRLQTYTAQCLIDRLSGGSTFARINLSDLRKLKITVANDTKEQQKIASFLSVVDEKIQQLTKKKALLQQYKKGVMQQLFSGQLRFKDENRNPYPDWVKGRFSKFIRLYRGSSPRPIVKYVTTNEDGVNWIKIGDTKNSNNYRISAVSEKITKEGSLKSRVVNKGEIILANSMSFGKSYLLQIDGCIYDGWFVLREYEESFDKEFMLQVLNSEFLQRQYLRLSTGGVVQNISSDIVYSTLLFCPVFEEQQKIATYLSRIDTKIESVTNQIIQTQSFKKGLLQQMFV